MVKTQTKSLIQKLGALFIVAFLLMPFAFLHAAILGMSASKTTVQAGQTFTATIDVNTQSQAINNVEAVVTFPTALLEVTSLQNGPVLSIWAESPTHSNSSGTISFNGGVPNPGFSGTGNVLRVNFKAKSNGVATIGFSSAFVRANDGLGTNILSGRSGVSISVTAAEIPTPVPVPNPDPTPTPNPEPAQPTPTPAPTGQLRDLIVIDEIPKKVKVGEQIKITGYTLIPNAKLEIYFSTEAGTIWTYKYTADDLGKINFVSEPFGKPGKFSVWLKSEPGAVNLLSSQVMYIEAEQPIEELIAEDKEKNTLEITWELGLLILFGILAILGWILYFKKSREFRALSKYPVSQTSKNSVPEINKITKP